MKRTRKKRRKKSKNKLILSITAVVISILALIVISYLSQPPRIEYTAEEYFQILGSTVDASDFPNWPDTSVVKLLAISFNITAVKGDAHGVVIESTAMSPTYALSDVAIPPVDDIAQGQIVFVSLQFGGGYISTLEEEGFPVTIRIRCQEAKGDLTFYIPFGTT